MRLATREDPHLPLARLRARGQLTELRATDLRFTLSEAAEFLNQMMGLDLSAEDTALLQTASLDRLTGSLCDAVRFGMAATPSSSDRTADDGQVTLEMLERANLFIVPLDEERRWYRYHHLFSDLLRQRLNQTQSEQLPMLYSRAREWFEHNGVQPSKSTP